LLAHCPVYPAADAVLQTNPTLLVNIEEADLEADPLYGEITTAG
jgi:hypothetical protein